MIAKRRTADESDHEMHDPEDPNAGVYLPTGTGLWDLGPSFLKCRAYSSTHVLRRLQRLEQNAEQ